MDTNRTGDEGNLSDLERRLGRWQPDAAGLDADAMLFAAGAASVERGGGQRLWPASCGLLLGLSALLGTWALLERAERQMLAARLGDRTPSTVTMPSADFVASGSSYTPSPRDYLHLRRRAEQDTSYQLASLQPVRTEAAGAQPPESAILSARQWSDLLD
jgi:hypothetical protein